MKKLYFMFLLLFLPLVGCSSESELGANDKKDQEVEVGEAPSEPVEEKSEPAEQEGIDNYSPEKSFISLEEFNQLFEQDPKEEQ